MNTKTLKDNPIVAARITSKEQRINKAIAELESAMKDYYGSYIYDSEFRAAIDSIKHKHNNGI